MKVACIMIVDALGRRMTTSPWLRLGEEYEVLAIMARPERSTLFLVSHGDTDIGWWDSRAFESSDERIPSTWVTRIRNEGVVDIAPKRWLERGYWEEFSDNDPTAVATFHEEVNAIVREMQRGGE